MTHFISLLECKRLQIFILFIRMGYFCERQKSNPLTTARFFMLGLRRLGAISAWTPPFLKGPQ